MVVMGLTSKVAGMMLGGASRHAGRKPPGKAERTRAKAEKAQKKAAEAQALRAEAEAKVAKEQDAVLARVLHEDEAQRRTDISELAEKEAEAIPEWPPDPSRGHGDQPKS
jgi:hypothetical protein